MSITQHNAELISVVEDLKWKCIIKKDTDIADITGYSKPP